MISNHTAKYLLWGMLCLITLPGIAEERPIQVTTAQLGEVAVYQEYSAPATTLSLNESRISAETTGVILRIPVQVGDRVERDALLTALDCRDNQLKLRKAEAGLAGIEARVTLAKRQIKRTQSLRKTSSVSEERLNQQEADLQIADADRQAQLAAIAEARLNQQRCEIKAPFAGVVRERLAGEGEWVNPGQPLIHLIDLERLEISAQVSVDRVASLQKAGKILLETNQGVYPVRLRQVVPVVESLGRNREVRLQFSDGRALPGSSGRLLWQSQQTYVPADLPVRRGDTLGLFTVDQGKARFVPLTQALEGHPTQVDLPADTLLVIEGRQALSDGAAIELAN
ncbi:efflux RND transporter periplasmic adaptor subunit [Sedimenticola sp.]|uniref:efflux RND transporter periplasmic adaptor subunit n=1 Tax=Sedimenticola sp. TaxID=1940285 RepID=UPI00258DC284|nr:efflux RND transporter periplasmic adaptor subunit [Sedimenticola sp.]MCW8902868.1 efflux RND transporter periplasmic adaptor subunit [Sedimenticola sp.]